MWPFFLPTPYGWLHVCPYFIHHLWPDTLQKISPARCAPKQHRCHVLPGDLDHVVRSSVNTWPWKSLRNWGLFMFKNWVWCFLPKVVPYTHPHLPIFWNPSWLKPEYQGQTLFPLLSHIRLYTLWVPCLAISGGGLFFSPHCCFFV